MSNSIIDNQTDHNMKKYRLFVKYINGISESKEFEAYNFIHATAELRLFVVGRNDITEVNLSQI